jgi:dipeptidyl aminopeptidase/acylaminoacyl peptidase
MSTTDQIPIDDYYDVTNVMAVAVSPDSDRVAFVTHEFDPEADERVASLFVAPTDGSRDPHRLTRVNGASSPQWGPDGDRLAFLAARDEDTATRVGKSADDDEGDEGDESEDDENEAEAASGDAPGNGEEEEPKQQVWLFDLALGGDARQITDFDEGAKSYDWGPDGDRLVVAARDPTAAEEAYLDERKDGGPVETERLQHKLDGVGYLDTVDTYLHVVDIESDAGEGGDATKLEEAYQSGAMSGLAGLQPAWGDGGRIAFVSCRTERPDDTLVQDVYTISPDGEDLRKLTDSDLSAAQPTWEPDGDRLAFVGSDPENWCIPTQVYLHEGWNEEDGTAGSYHSLTADLDRTVARGGEIHWADDETLYTRIGDEGKTRLLRIGTDGASNDDGAEQPITDRVFKAQGDDRALPQFDYADEQCAVVLSHPSEGADVYSVATEDLDAETEPDSLTRLSTVNADLTEKHAMPDVRRVSWESDGHEIEGVVYSDPAVDLEDGDHPLVVAIHGGPVSYDEPEFSFNHAVLTSRGYVVFRPNYRGGSSYGRDFCEQLHGQWGTVEVDDIVAGVADLTERGWADEDRVFGYGFSYGGIAQGFLVTQTDVFTAAAPEHGIYDLRSAFGTDDSHNWMDNEYGLPWEVPEEIDASSAITDAGNIDTPLLVTAGGQDWRCPPSQSEQLYVAARKQGVDARLVVYEDEHHNIGDPDRAIHRLEEVTAWYERHDPAVDADGADDPHDRAETGENGDEE